VQNVDSGTVVLPQIITFRRLALQNALVSSGLREYYGNPEEPSNAVDEAYWLNTGDIGTMENGYCRITSSIEDRIIRGDENINSGK
jgi:acyl-CoA synthetase (AMP-forming)/AMP-acid ligase II